MAQRIPWKSPQEQPVGALPPPFPHVGTPLSPEYMDRQQPVLDAQSRLQDAYKAQGQAQGPPEGIEGIITNPIFQLAVPTLLSTLSAVFPRTMGPAAGIGMAGLRTVNDVTSSNIQNRRSSVAEQVKQRLEDLNREKGKFVVDDLRQAGADPLEADTVEQAWNLDPEMGAQGGIQLAGKVAKKNAPPEPLDMSNMSQGLKDLSLATPRSPDQNDSEYVSSLRGIEANEKRAIDERNFQQQLELQRTGNQLRDDDRASTRNATAGQAEDMAKGWMDGTLPLPNLGSGRGVLTNPVIAEATKIARANGMNITKAWLDQQATVRWVQSANNQQRQMARIGLKTVEQMVNNVESAYDYWAALAGDKLSRFRTVNDIMQFSQKELGTEGAAAAAALETVLAETNQQLGTVIRSGFAPTVDSARVAEKLLRGNEPVKMFKSRLAEARTAVGVRLWGFENDRPMGVGGSIQGGQFPAVPEGPNAYTNPLPGASLPYSPGGQSGTFKNKRELAQAISEGRISIEAGKKYASIHKDDPGWND